MFLLTPVLVDSANLVASNIPIDDAPTYNPATTYQTGDQVVFEDRLYESAIDNNTGNTPQPGASTPWLDLGAVNRFRAFDVFLDSKATRADEITYSILPGRIVNAVGLFRMNAGSVTITMTDPDFGVVYDVTRSLDDSGEIADWADYFFTDVELKTRDLFSDLPSYRNATIDITIRNIGATAEVGEIALGPLKKIGDTLFGTSFGIIDYSRKETDEFGNTIIVERGFADRISFDVDIQTSEAFKTKNLLTSVRSVPAVYIGTLDREETFVYGFYKDWDVVLSNPLISSVSIEIEGLV